MLCSKCRRRAIIYQRYSGLHLCKAHFIADFEAKAKRAIRTHHWIIPDDRIAVALSGGKDSSALLFFLKKLIEKAPFHDNGASLHQIGEDSLWDEIGTTAQPISCVGEIHDRQGRFSTRFHLIKQAS